MDFKYDVELPLGCWDCGKPGPAEPDAELMSLEAPRLRGSNETNKSIEGLRQRSATVAWTIASCRTGKQRIVLSMQRLQCAVTKHVPRRPTRKFLLLLECTAGLVEVLRLQAVYRPYAEIPWAWNFD